MKLAFISCNNNMMCRGVLKYPNIAFCSAQGTAFFHRPNRGYKTTGHRLGNSFITVRMADEQTVKDIWRNTDCVSFDVDSTVCTDEAIDELAAFLGVGTEVAGLTKNAMQGSMTYQESLAARLKLMRPSRQQVADFLEKHPPRLTPGVKEVVDELQSKNVPVYLVSGGFTSIIEKVAEALDVPKSNIFANKLLFYFNGDYAGFDTSCPTSETGGKPKVIQQLKDKFGYKRVVQIGDGVTDMEACPPADAFIGFGGNQVRDKVKLGSKWFVTDFRAMLDELKRPSL